MCKIQNKQLFTWKFLKQQLKCFLYKKIKFTKKPFRGPVGAQGGMFNQNLAKLITWKMVTSFQVKCSAKKYYKHYNINSQHIPYHLGKCTCTFQWKLYTFITLILGTNLHCVDRPVFRASQKNTVLSVCPEYTELQTLQTWKLLKNTALRRIPAGVHVYLCLKLQ